VVLLAATRYFRSRIDGYTGDCLGATQQVAEIAIYLVLLAALR
jgi:adenosylcobinamide-GDP ribazoletransferase